MQENKILIMPNNITLLTVDCHQGDVSHKLNQARIGRMNCCTLSSDVQVKELQQLASDRSIDVQAFQKHRRTLQDEHKSLLFPGWQSMLNETPSPWVGGIGFLLSPYAVKALLFFFFPSHCIGKILLDVSESKVHVNLTPLGVM